jgi:SHS2 domain-containing protein
MNGRYSYIDHTADIAVKVTASSVEDLFKTAADALRDSTAENINYNRIETKKISLNEYSQEELLVSFLNELNYFFSVKKWMLRSVIDIVLEEYEQLWQLKALCEGSPDAEFSPKTEIKAVTFHQMEIKNEKGIYTCTIVFDI